jgi:hypothetical protein
MGCPKRTSEYGMYANSLALRYGEVRGIFLLGIGVKMVSAAAHLHGFGVARQGLWCTVEKPPRCPLSLQIGQFSSPICDRYQLSADSFNTLERSPTFSCSLLYKSCPSGRGYSLPPVRRILGNTTGCGVSSVCAILYLVQLSAPLTTIPLSSVVAAYRCHWSGSCGCRPRAR